MKKKSLGALALAVLVSSGALMGSVSPALAGVPASPESYVPAPLEEMTTRDLVKSIYFDQGPLAQQLRDEGASDLPNNEGHTGEIESLVDQVLTENPTFITVLEEIIATGDPYQMEDALSTGGTLFREAGSVVGVNEVLDGTGTGAVTWIFVVNWVIPMVLMTPATPAQDSFATDSLSLRSFSADGEPAVDDVAAVVKVLTALRSPSN